MSNNKITRQIKSFFYALICITLLTGAPTSFAENKDPWEGFNRGVFTFNMTLDHFTLSPIARAYRFVTPEIVQTGVSNVFDNLGEPINFGNNLLQLKFRDAGIDVSRFFFNSTFGLLGTFDVASKMGLKRSNQDFGLTLAHWGVPSGPYMVLPFYGPSTIRDSVGMVPDYFMEISPFPNDVGARNTTFGVSILDKRARLVPFEDMIVGDPYIFIRNAYLESRELAVKGYVEDDF